VDPEQFFTASGVIIVAGKGGVGKTAVTAACAVAASAVGLRTLVVEVEGKGGLAAMFGSDRLSYDELVLVPAGGHTDLGDGTGGTDGTGTAGGVTARTITPDDALLDYLRDHGMQRISNRLVSTGALDMISTAVPGIRDILVLGKIKQLERGGEFDLILVDAPAAGHAISFLRSASGLADAVKVGPISTQARDVLELLDDPARCRVVLVTVPEETPVNELIETAYSLEDEVGVALGPVIVNGVLDELPGLGADPATAAAAQGVQLLEGEAELLAEAARFRLARSELQRSQLERMAQDLPLPQLHLPYLNVAALERDGLHTLARTLLTRIAELPERSPAT
jgi:anion-transporting  ArsA/GET3 family ATPase